MMSTKKSLYKDSQDVEHNWYKKLRESFFSDNEIASNHKKDNSILIS